MTKKKIILCVTIIALSILGIFAFKSFQKYQKQYTGKQWYERQSDYINELSVYAGEMDDIFSLYCLYYSRHLHYTVHAPHDEYAERRHPRVSNVS